ncbi:MAG: hypothetical protein R3E39_08005 [Anaerolineae bacterium]
MNGEIILVFLLITLGTTYVVWATSRPKHLKQSTIYKRVSTANYSKSSQPSLHITPRTKEEEIYGKLLSMNLGDRAKVERLIDYERKRFPSATRLELVERAYDRQDGDSARYR